MPDVEIPGGLPGGRARIGFLGPEGTFTEQALLSQPDLAALELVALPSIPEVLAAVEGLTGRADALAAGAAATDPMAAAFARAGVAGWLHAVDIDRGDEIGLGADEPVAIASVFKLPVLVALFRGQAAAPQDTAAAAACRHRTGPPA